MERNLLGLKGAFQCGWLLYWYVGVSKNRGTPKSSILIGFPLINHPFWGTTIFGNTHVSGMKKLSSYFGFVFCWVIFLIRIGSHPIGRIFVGSLLSSYLRVKIHGTDPKKVD